MAKINITGYVLISVYDREILTEQFDSLEKAQSQMHKEIVEAGGISPDFFQKNEYDDGEWGFCEYSAYISDGNNHENVDWRIVPVEFRGEI